MEFDMDAKFELLQEENQLAAKLVMAMQSEIHALRAQRTRNTDMHAAHIDSLTLQLTFVHRAYNGSQAESRALRAVVLLTGILAVVTTCLAVMAMRVCV